MTAANAGFASLAALVMAVGYPGGMLASEAPSQSCFLLHEIGGGEVVRDPVAACLTAVSPAATFNIPHALAALESGSMAATGQATEFNSALWPESVAVKLGLERERIYLQLFNYGNREPGRQLKEFWLNGSLRITPEQQLEFLVRLYQGELVASATSIAAVRAMLVQPDGMVNTPEGPRPFNRPWPGEVQVSAQAGTATERSGRVIHWLVGHIARPEQAYVFVSCVVGANGLDSNAAIDLAARSLRDATVL